MDVEAGLDCTKPSERVGGDVGRQLALLNGHAGAPEREQSGREEEERDHVGVTSYSARRTLVCVDTTHVMTRLINIFSQTNLYKNAQN